MYRYNSIDRRIVMERVAQFRDQTRRHLAGELSADEFRPLRLQNGLYIQRHAPMLRIAIPYGQLASHQLRKLAAITRRYDRGVGHFSTRSNLQLNWVKLEDVPDILSELAKVEMHAIQTSGNCVRNTTVDALAGVSPTEIADPRPWAELVRQWSTLHPEFAFLPRKFKIAISGGPDDAAGSRVHDIGLRIQKDNRGEIGFTVSVGGGLGRTPLIGQTIREFLPWPHLLTYLEAILRLYNLYGRRDNAFKARIKILVKALGVAEFSRQVEEEWTHLKEDAQTLCAAEVERMRENFADPPYQNLADYDIEFATTRRANAAFASWLKTNIHDHRVPGYRAVTLSLKAPGQAPGDATAEQMEAVADFAERFSFGEIRTTQAQNLLLPDVRLKDLYALWQEAQQHRLATPTVGLIGDITCCPGGDYCGLANARSIPLAQSIQQRFADLAEQAEIGPLKLNISGCMNACSHHHVGHIGLLGVDKQGEEFYQLTLGGFWGREGNQQTAIGTIVGPSFSREEAPLAVERVVRLYQEQRRAGEKFVDTLQRVGFTAFKAAAYDKAVTVSEPETEAING